VRDHLTRPAAACPQPFDAAFRVINQRRDISAAAKLTHAHLVTLHRTGRDATQTEIGEALGMSRHQVWRAIGELVAAGLVQTIRYGLGRPNGYVLLALDEDDLNGRASGRRPVAGAVAGPVRPRARGYRKPEEHRKNGRYTGSSDLMVSRYGPVQRR
jgi:biotin operon repressor